MVKRGSVYEEDRDIGIFINAKGMNEFQLYEMLCAAESAAVQYREGKNVLERIRRAKNAVSTRKYKLAVVGEFKRGKSSLINALVGSSLLPADVLPTTAVVNRIIFGSTKKITVFYKDGRTKEGTVEELADYATKLDGEKRERSEQIREVIVEYPSVFCRNGIEIIDTPGLNDNEQMSEVTLLEQKGIRHITFVITFIDQISGRKSEQEKIVAFIRQRIQKEVLADARECFEGNDRLVQKAEGILQNPVVFAVSSVLALKGFSYDDPELLQESRFPDFKQELFDLLTADQNADMFEEAKACLQELLLLMPDWKKKQEARLHEQYQLSLSLRHLQEAYRRESGHYLRQKMAEIEKSLEKKGCNSVAGLSEASKEKLIYTIKQMFVKELGAIKRGLLSEHTVRNVLRLASEEAICLMEFVRQDYRKWIQEDLTPVYQEFFEWRVSCGLEESSFKNKMKAWEAEVPFPEFRWHGDTLLAGHSLLHVNIIALEENIIRESLSRFGKSIAAYLSSWRSVLFWQNTEDCRDINAMKEDIHDAEFVKMQIDMEQKKYEKNNQILMDWKSMLKES